MSTLKVESLCAGHPPVQRAAVRQVDFEVAEGSLTGLLGPSGCGKSTVLRVIAGLHPPTSGRVLLDGMDLARVPTEQRPIAAVLQGSVNFPHLTVRENIGFPLHVKGIPSGQARARADDVLHAVGLAAVAESYPAALPEGQRQLLALARAIAQQPSVLLLDEPLSNVDPHARRAIRDRIRDVVKRLALTVLYVTHDRGEALAVSDRIVLMDAGEVIEAGTPRQLYRAPTTRFAAEFMGDSTTLPAHRGQDGLVRLGSLVLPQLPAGEPGPVRIAFRPEAWTIVHANVHGVPGCVLKRNFLGRLVEYAIGTPFGTVLVHTPYRGAWLDLDAPVSLRVSPSAALWVVDGSH